MNRKICRIICAGENKNYSFSFSKDDFIIAVDGGYNYLKTAKIMPDLIVGDFDSLGFVPEGENIIKLQTAKDETDTYYAIKTAIERGFTDFYIYCGTGGDIDHTIANIQSIVYIAKQGLNGFLFDGDKVVTAIFNDKIKFDSSATGKISIISADEKSYGVSIKGLLYEADNIEISNSFPIGVRNEFIGKESEISVKNGCILIIFDYNKINNIRSLT